MPMPVCLPENEARIRWCPFSRTEQRLGENSECIASSCMAWRWMRTWVPGSNDTMIESRDTHGFCGLAGDPNLGDN